MNAYTLNAALRSCIGKAESRRLRRLSDTVPAIVYGGSSDPQSISLVSKDVAKLIEDETAYSHIIELNLNGIKEPVIIKELQRHPAKGNVMHMDLVRVVNERKLTITVPIRFLGEEVLIKSGCEISHILTKIEVSCLPEYLPEVITLDLSSAHAGSIIHLSDMTVPDGVEFISLSHGNDLPVVSVHSARSNTGDDAVE